jgi:hypothetical protein
MPSPSSGPRQTQFSNHTVIFPPNRLKSAIIESSGSGIAMDPVAHAEAALKEIQEEFGGWMRAECEMLKTARAAVHSGATPASIENLLNAATDIGGNAAMLGFPFAGKIADVLCKLISREAELGRIPLKLIDEHIDAICAAVRDGIKDQSGPAASAIIGRLAALTGAYIKASDAEALLPMIESPKL